MRAGLRCIGWGTAVFGAALLLSCKPQLNLALGVKSVTPSKGPASKEKPLRPSGVVIDDIEADNAQRVAETAALECPGVSILFGRASLGQKPLRHLNFGYADLAEKRLVRDDTIFRLSSLSSTIISAALLPLLAAGKVSLVNPVSRWLPDFKLNRLRVWEGKASRPALKNICILDVLRGTTGLFLPSDPDLGPVGLEDPDLTAAFREAGVLEAKSTEDFLRRLSDVPLCEEAGERFRWSPAIRLLVPIIEMAAGMPFQEYVQNTLLGPLGMTDTGFSPKEDQQPRLATLYRRVGMTRPASFEEVKDKFHMYKDPVVGDAELYSTVEDFARFVRFLLSDGQGIVRQDLLRAFAQNRLGSGVVPDLCFPAGFGLGTYVHDKRISGWSGLNNVHFFADMYSGRYAILMAQVLPFSWRYQEFLTHQVRKAMQMQRGQPEPTRGRMR